MTRDPPDHDVVPDDEEAAVGEPRRRWWLLAVDGLLLVVLSAAVGWTLLLSSHGLSASLTVRLTIAAIVLVLVGQAIVRRLLRPGRWFQFSLRTLLLFVLVCGYGLGLLTPKLLQRSAVRQLRNLGCNVRFKESSTPTWLCDLVGEEFLAEVDDVMSLGP